jgi:chromosomal replication initiation ATPase DnaA
VTTGGQLVFNLTPRAALGREAFLVSGSNREAVAWIDRWPDWPIATTGLNVYGPRASGKTHLGEVWRARSKAGWLNRPIETNEAVPGLLGDLRDMVIDGLDEEWPGEPLLHLHNMIAERGGAMLVLSRSPCARLALSPPDLTSRLSAMPAVEIGFPDDTLIIGVMSKLFRDRQMQVARDVLEYVASRMQRSLAEASRLVDLLDRMALAEGRPITLPLARLALSQLVADVNDECNGD